MQTLDAVANWVLPMNVHWFIVLLIVGAIASIVAWVWTSNNYSKLVGDYNNRQTVTYPFRTFLRGTIALLVTVVSLSTLVWLIYAYSRPVEIEAEERLEIKPVVYPNGRVVQMFSCNEVNHNANVMFSSAPPEGSYVRRLIYKRVYCGVYFPNMNSPTSSLNDGFFLVTPDKQERKATNVTTGN